MGGVTGPVGGAIRPTLELTGDLGDGLASGEAALDLVLRETIVQRVLSLHDLDEGVDRLVQNVEFGVEGGGGGLVGSSRNWHGGIIPERVLIVNIFLPLNVSFFPHPVTR